jgi:hypothetical protein
MKHRYLAWTGALTTAAAILSLMPAHLSGQTPASKVPRTPWGAPDLQGIWSQQTLTPFERPKEYAGREFLTEEEIAARTMQLSTQPTRSLYRETRKESGTEQDVAGAYNAVWEQDRPTKAGRRTSQVIDPPDGRLPPLTAQAQQRQAAMTKYLEDLLQGTSGGRPGEPIANKSATSPPEYNLERMNRADGPEDRSQIERCFGNSMPAFGAIQRIVQSPESVQIYYDMGQGHGFTRVVPITSAPHAPPSVRFSWGDSRGRWEGDTLVVDVTNFTNRMQFRGARENLHLIERFTRVDENTLTYQMTVEDPTVWTRPWTAIAELNKNPDKPNLIFEQTCHEGNYGMIGMLANTRAAEKLFKEGKGTDPDRMDIATGGGGGDR